MIDRIRKVSKRVTNDDLAQAEFMAKRLKHMEQQSARRFGLSYETYRMILNGEAEVDNITYTVRPRRQWKTVIGYISIAAMAVLLLLCLSVQGMADSLRASILRVFSSLKAVQVVSVAYDQYAGLQGYTVPSLMPSGYVSSDHTATSTMLHISYVNETGEEIQYSYYPLDAAASYDNEHDKHRVFNSKFGTVHVWQVESGRSTACLLVDGAYVQLDFDIAATDDEIRRIVDGLNRVD